jgi:hypothetical protein
MNIEYPVQVEVRLRPLWHKDPPEINIGIGDDLEKIVLENEQTFGYNFTAAGRSQLTIEFLNKTNEDTVADKGLDKAIVIESVGFFGITDPKFVWSGIYKPVYPEPWATEQRQQGVVLQQQIHNQTYLAWNGKWTLTFTVPVFTWIHNVQNLGWIYG